MIKLNIKIDDRRLMNLIRNTPKIGHELVKKAGYVGLTNAKKGIVDTRTEWQPLSQRTIDSKGHDKILIETQALLKSLFTESQGNKAIYGTNISYGAAHEFGLGTPRRAFLRPTTEGMELQEMKEELEQRARVLFYKYSR